MQQVLQYRNILQHMIDLMFDSSPLFVLEHNEHKPKQKESCYE